MNRKEHKRHMAYEALILLGMLAFLTFICRLWPILLLIILGIFVAVIRLLFLSSKTVEPIEVQTTVQEPTPIPTEKDVRDLAYGVIQRRVTELVLAEFPQARWIWENPNARKSIESGESVYILLNRAGGYRRAKVEVQNLQIVGIQFCTAEGPCPQNESEENMESTENHDEGFTDETSDDSTCEEIPENYELLAFEWTESHMMDLNERCNEAIGQGKQSILISEEELPAKQSWKNICDELMRSDIELAVCQENGIEIKFAQ